MFVTMLDGEAENNTASDIISGRFIKYYLRYIKCIILTGNLYENMLI